MSVLPAAGNDKSAKTHTNIVINGARFRVTTITSLLILHANPTIASFEVLWANSLVSPIYQSLDRVHSKNRDAGVREDIFPFAE